MTQLVMLRPPEVPLAALSGAPPVRRATAADTPALARLLGAAFPEQDWPEDRVRRDLLAAADVPATFVVEETGGLIATASVRYTERFPDSGYVHWVAVDPAARGRRLARVVMDAVIRTFIADGRTSAILETDDPRLPAIASYLGQGFIPHYRDPDHAQRWSRVFMTMAQRQI